MRLTSIRTAIRRFLYGGDGNQSATEQGWSEATRLRVAALVLRLIVCLGVVTLLAALWQVVAGHPWTALALFLGLAGATEFLEVRVYNAGRERISFSFTIVVTMAAVAAVPEVAPIASGAAALAHVLITRQRRWSKVLFNIANPVCAAAAAASVYTALAPGDAGTSLLGVVVALAATAAFYALNTGAVALMISLHAGQPLWAVLRSSGWYAPVKICLGMMGVFLGAHHAALDLGGLLIFVAPLAVLRFTLVLYARNTEDTIARLQAAKQEVEQAHREKEETLRGMIDTVASIIDAREPWVLGHSRRVARYAVALAEELGLSAEETATVQTAGLLHDLGKVAIPETILNKPGRLTDEEYIVMKQHAAMGQRILGDIGPLQSVARMVGEHHERYNGSGYPNRKRGEEISLGGRIVALADALDAILSDRPYSRARPLEWALAEVERCAGAHFDPDVVAALQRVVARQGTGFFATPASIEELPDCCRSWTADLGVESEGEDVGEQGAEPVALPYWMDRASA